jgi:hypothetical protein
MRKRAHPWGWLALLACAALPARAEDAAAGPEAGAGVEAPVQAVEEHAPPPRWAFWLLAQEQYRFRATTTYGADPIGDERDHDLRLFLDGGAISPDDDFQAHLSAALWLDVDGNTQDGRSTALAELTGYQRLWWDIYSLSAEYRSDGALKLARGGRQVTEHGPPVTFDGVALDARAAGRLLEVFALGGRTVHFFELSAGMFEDWLGSAGLVLRPLAGLRLELDYRFQLEDTLTADKITKEQRIDHGYGLTLAYALEDRLRVQAKLRGVNAQVALAGADLHFEHQPWELGLDLGLDAQPATLRELSERLDPLYAILGESLPNLRWHLDAWKDFSTQAGRYGLHLGFVGRHVLSGEEGPFNRSLAHVYAAAVGHDIGLRGLYASLSLEEHFTLPGSSQPDEHQMAVGGALGYDGAWLQAEAGSYYQRFKYDYFANPREVADVRTVYGQLGFKALGWLSVRARYEFEWTDRDVHTLTLTLGQSI